jgi:hypothetical protein
MELSFFTNDELVKELLSRQTFAGIIVKTRDPLEEIRDEPIIQFDMMWGQTIPESTVKKLLDEAILKLGDKENV